MMQQRVWKRFASVLVSGCMALSGMALLPVTAGASTRAADASTVTWVMTQEGNYWQTQPELTITEWDEENKSDLYIDIDENITYQQMAEHVWGGCFNERGWKYLNELPEADRNHILDLLFDPDEEDGLHLTLARMPIGSSDYAIDSYSLDDVEDDYELEHFSIERDKNETTGLIPYIREALKRQPDLKIWASPWSPPSWLKDNRKLENGKIVYNEKNMECYARYFKKFIEAYKAEGIDIYMVSPQNEPTINNGYAGCIWTGEQLRDFVRDYLGPAMEELGVEIYLGTFTNSSDKLVDPLLNDPDAKNYISGITFQWWSYLKAHSLYYTGFDLGMMQSETMCGDGNNNWAYAEHQFDLMWMYLESGIDSYNLWNMALEWDGVNPGGRNVTGYWTQNAPITVNETTKEYTVNPQYYQYKHFTNYIQPGARRILSSGTYDAEFPLKDGEGDNSYTEVLHEIAFRNPDGSNVLLVKNGSNEAKHVDMNFNGRKVSADIPAHSINTFTTAGTPLTGTETDMRESIPEDKIVRLTNKGTKQALCIEGNGGAVNNTSHIFQWTYGGEANQQWYLEPGKVGDTETVKLVNIKSGKIVAVDGGSKDAGAKLILWPYVGEVNQNWILEEADNGCYRFKNADSGHYLAGNAASWAEQRSLNQSDETQLWKIEYLAEETAPTKKEVAAFEAAVEKAEALNPNAYTADSYAAVQAALQAAELVDKTNRAAVRKAAKALEEAVRALKAQLNKSALETAIANASAKVQNQYTAESWQKLQTALEEANRIRESDTAMQDEIDAAVQTLNDAVAGLVPQEEKTEKADKSALEAAIANASAKVQSNYTSESWQKLQAALAKANKVKENAAAAQEDVNAAEKALNDALSALAAAAPAAEIGAPTAVKAAWSGGKNVKVTWEQAANADTYEVYRSYKKNSGFAKLASVKGTSYTDTKAAAGKTAYYKVIACAGTRKSAYSAAASLYILKAPAGLKAKVSKGAVTISFGKVKSASGYEIYRAAKKNGTYKKAAVLKSAKTVKKKLKLKKGKYFFKVRAYQTVKSKKRYTGYSKAIQAKVK